MVTWGKLAVVVALVVTAFGGVAVPIWECSKKATPARKIIEYIGKGLVYGWVLGFFLGLFVVVVFQLWTM